ncbi:MAG: hypothetical protein DRJ03_22145 [Chloroflexi bacterium]|nr:MAG: hypothetical protein DRJ03_22145 [Chloroflexota bacterium]
MTTLKRLRIQKGLSQRQLAELIGVHPSYISLIERGKRPGSIRVLKKLSLFFNVPLDTLVK